MNQIKSLALLTDLYELTMAAGYYEQQMFEPAAFSLFVRNYPFSRRYFVSAGLADVLSYLENLKFESEDLAYLDKTGLFKSEFLSYLEEIRFTGDVFALPEGRLFFTDEPLLEITAPLIEAQIVETFIINAIHLQTMIATKASRCVHAAWPRKLVDFSLRRTHGTDAGLKVARASFIGGFAGTSNVLAGKIYNIPLFGTMAHSFITSFEEEIDAFRAFVQSFPENAVLLLDTYDTLEGAKIAAEVGREMVKEGKELKGVRLDSGNFVHLSKKVREVLRKAGLEKTTIFASGGFDEYKIHKILSQAADIDSFGVGTKMGVSSDAPFLDMAYKMVQYDNRPVLKLSPGKSTLAGEKQIFRFLGSEGKLKKDVIGLRGDDVKGAEPLLEKVMERGKVIVRMPLLSQIQKRFFDEFSRLEEKYKSFEREEKKFPVSLSPRLDNLQSQVVIARGSQRNKMEGEQKDGKI
jgi:nicotinate phosphoribosyltransferase